MATASSHNSNNNTDQAHQTVCTALRAAKMVLKQQLHPPYVSLRINSIVLRSIGLWWPLEDGEEDPRFTFVNALILLASSIFALTLVLHLPESSQDYVGFGEDLVIVLGTSLIYTKMLIYRVRSQEIGLIIADLQRLHARHSLLKAKQRSHIRRQQRRFFLAEVGVSFTYVVVSSFFSLSLCIQPLFIGRLLPFRAKFPAALQDPRRHPFAVAGIYVFQCACIVYNVLSLVMMEGVAWYIMSQSALNLKILGLRIRELAGDDAAGGNRWHDLREIVKDHQLIIGIVERTNEVFWTNYLCQIASSNYMICLTAFEILMNSDQPAVVIKFSLYMGLAFAQIFCWCWNGNMVSSESQELGNAAYEIKDWFQESPSFQRSLVFVIMRAQKPLIFRPRHFRPFNYETFTGLLSSSYSYLTLLRNFND